MHCTGRFREANQTKKPMCHNRFGLTNKQTKKNNEICFFLLLCSSVFRRDTLRAFWHDSAMLFMMLVDFSYRNGQHLISVQGPTSTLHCKTEARPLYRRPRFSMAAHQRTGVAKPRWRSCIRARTDQRAQVALMLLRGGHVKAWLPLHLWRIGHA